MRELGKEELLPGMVTGADIFNYANQLVVPKGTVLTDYIITRLEHYSILRIPVEDGGYKMPDPVKSELSHSQRLRKTPEFKEYKKEFEKNVASFEFTINEIVDKNRRIDEQAVYSGMSELIKKSTEKTNVFDMIRNLRQYDDSTYAHAVNVSLISSVLAQWVGYDEAGIRMATMCGLFHDIGKLKMPSEIIKKPGRLTDEEYTIIQRHPLDGFEILKKQNISSHIMKAALMHHEKCDGSGYPLHLTAPDIDEYAKLVAIADVYEAMTSARIYRGPMCPFEVISIFENEGLQKYDVAYVTTFLEHVAHSYIGEDVRLSNGMEGKIVMVNRQTLSKPVIQCGDLSVDLARNETIKVQEIL